MKKVLFVATVVQMHINVFHLPYLKYFQQQGYKTYVAAANDTDSEQVSIPYCDEYTEISFKRNPLHPRNIKAYFELKRLIRENDFELIHCHTPVGGLLGRLAARGARNKGTKILYTAHGFHFYRGAPLKNWLIYYTAEKICSFMTDVLITINKEDYALALKKMKAKRVEYVPGVGIDTGKFADALVDVSAKRREIGVPEDAFLMVSVGELSKRKNQEVVIRAMADIPDSKLHYILAGNGPLIDYLRECARECGVEDRVHFLGYRNDIPDLYKISDLCCFPSVHEGLPVALMEAMVCGLPVVCSKIRGNTDLIDGRGGILFEYSSVQQCRKAIEDIRSADMAAMGEYNRESVQKYSVGCVTEIMKNIYEG